jgi:hypothetical protein
MNLMSERRKNKTPSKSRAPLGTRLDARRKEKKPTTMAAQRAKLWQSDMSKVRLNLQSMGRVRPFLGP